MQTAKYVQVVNAHCEGENGSVVVGGILSIPGATMQEKYQYLNGEGRSLQRFLCFEPRGVPHGSVNLVMPPCRDDADAAFIILQPDGAHPMSGSNAICVTTVLLETGMIPMTEPETIVRLDTAAGLVTAVARCEQGKCVDVTLSMVPSFVEELAVPVPYQGQMIHADIAFGGDYYGIVDIDQLGLEIAPHNAHILFDIGIELVNSLNERYQVQHPEYPTLNKLSYVMFRNIDGSLVQTCTTLKPGRCDRSPCGTGSSANLATMYARGLVKEQDTLTSQSIIGSQFRVTLSGTTTIGDKTAVLPKVTGRAWIYATQQLLLDPTDPFNEGFTLSDTWGRFIDELTAH
ncbi:proline racemase [Maribrevibacterium harenarium]|uniref:Proline racemase n=1 Tax=Maribrevibacterium harenarium TaxID=2589817 RepID=A0A501WM98_9GAMM|nr:proline racemase family protein [Maribrevibacterium harenarium]TPE49470.1 proline racemase [Maribrevibacterium harenarium]